MPYAELLGGKRNAYKVWQGKPAVEWQLGRLLLDKTTPLFSNSIYIRRKEKIPNQSNHNFNQLYVSTIHSHHQAENTILYNYTLMQDEEISFLFYCILF